MVIQLETEALRGGVAGKLILLTKKIKIVEGAGNKSPHYNSIFASRPEPPARGLGSAGS